MTTEIEVSRFIRNFRRRTRYHQNLDRPKVWPSTGSDLCLSLNREILERHDAALAILKTTQDTWEYVRAWCILNRLVL